MKIKKIIKKIIGKRNYLKPHCINCNNYKKLNLDGYEFIENLCNDCLNELMKIEIRKKWEYALSQMSEEERIKTNELIKEISESKE